jgi:hypothetical protein
VSQFLALWLLCQFRDMKGRTVLIAPTFALLAVVFSSSVALAAVSSSFPAQTAAERDRARTNWVENTVTNLIEIRMERNRFVTEYRTNWTERLTTNVFDIYKTNQLTRNLTNRFVVDAWNTNFVDVFHTNLQHRFLTNDIAIEKIRTNAVDAYHTNWSSVNRTNSIVLNRFQTNLVDSYRTNWKQLTLTNEVAVNRVRTNVVDLYKTNWQNLHLTNEIVLNSVRTNFVDAYATNSHNLFLTNWQTVVVMKTNWVTQFVTNVAQLDLPRVVTVSAPPVQKTSISHVPVPAPSLNSSEDPVIEVSRTSKAPANGLVEVELKIRWPADTADAPPVQQWRIERENGAFLSFGQEQEFRRDLPVGSYAVQARLQRDAESPSFVLRGTLTVTIKEAIVQQRTDKTKVATVQ